MLLKINVKFISVLICSVFLLSNTNAQQSEVSNKIMLPEQEYNLSQIFEILITNYHINLSYDSDLDNIKTTVSFPGKVYTLKSVLHDIESQCKTIEFIIRKNSIIAKKKKEIKKVTINGFIRSESDGETLPGATVYDVNSSAGTIANKYGFFSIQTSAENVHIRFSFTGYHQKELTYSVSEDTLIDIKLSTNNEIDEVVVHANKNESLESLQASMSKIELKKSELLPQLIGESDLMKSIQLLPGVQSGTEGTGGLYVRGGSQGNNLILLDGAPVYNSNHFWGLFSVINTEALQNVTLYKGGFPAQYGGRLSSVVDIQMKEGNSRKFGGSGSLGLISSKILFEGPIIQDKTSFIITGRRSIPDLIAKPLMQQGSFLSGLRFHDANFKINHQISARSRLFFSCYNSFDQMKISLNNDFLGNEGDESSHTLSTFMGWGNVTSSLRWNNVLTKKIFLNTTFTYSLYKTNGTGESKGIVHNRYQEKTDKYKSDLESKAASFDFSWYPGISHTIKFGGKYIFNDYPYLKRKRLKKDSVLSYDQIYFDTTFHTNEIHAYIQDEMELLTNLKVRAGCHASLYRISNKTFHSLEPRIALRYILSPVWSVKAAFTEMTQYDFQKPDMFELVRNEEGYVFNLNPEIWLPCTKLLPPQKSQQFVFGTYLNIKSQYHFSIEGFYSKMENVIDDRMFIVDDIPNIWEELFQSGNGRSYGSEILLEKKTGKLTGRMAYTLSKTERQFEHVNNGQYYPYQFDRTHNLTIVLNYVVNKKIDIGIIWDYKSGRRLTVPDGQYTSNLVHASTNLKGKNDLYAMSKVNAYRLPAYHRLDVGVNFHKQKKKFSRTFSFGVYNIYNKHNSFLIYTDYRKVKDKTDTNKEVVKSLSLFPFLPYVNYKIKF